MKTVAKVVAAIGGPAFVFYLTYLIGKRFGPLLAVLFLIASAITALYIKGNFYFPRQTRPYSGDERKRKDGRMFS